jgi:flagella basal body P-ring formation protein FlgA
MIRYVLALLLMAGSICGCEHMTGERITGSDLARVLPLFSAMPPDAILGYAPSPGSKRVFRADEINRIAARYGLQSSADNPICFDFELQPVSKERAREAMQQMLEIPGLRLEIVRLSRAPAPKGEVVFPKAGLAAVSVSDLNAVLLWRGFVVYGRERHFDLWAEVKISAAMPRVVAVRDLAIGEPIPAGAVRLETEDDSPLRNDIARQLDEVVGRIPSRSVRAGSPIQRLNLSAPFDVKRGDTVAVRATSGDAVLTTEAQAESSGRKGESILLKNPASGKMFRGRIDGPDSVVVVAGQAMGAKRT